MHDASLGSSFTSVVYFSDAVFIACTAFFFKNNHNNI